METLMTLVRSRSTLGIWQCRPFAGPVDAQVVVLSGLSGVRPLDDLLNPPYSPGQAALLADAAVADTLQALGGLPSFANSTAGHAFRRLSGPSLLLGTRTPQVDSDLLADSAGRLDSFDAVLGGTTAGGWWAFGLRDPQLLGQLMPAMRETGALALAMLRLGLRVAMLPTLRALHNVVDVPVVAAKCRPGSYFAATVADLEPFG
jgi:hypothetical protein